MKLVICEGKQDIAVLKGICDSSTIAGLTIEGCGGRDNLERYLVDLHIRPEFTRMEVESVAIMIDAEASAEASWQKLKNAVQLAFKAELIEQGVFAGDRPRIGGFVVSGDGGRGMIEDLCLASVSDRPGYACLEEYFKCLADKTDQKKYHPKAKFRAWMASQSEYEFHVGKAAEKGFLPWDNPAFTPLREFLRQL
jgi:hypothetical protein